MNITKDSMILYIALVVGAFYYIITDNRKEIERRDTIITEQQKTMDLQTDAINAQSRQIFYLQQYYNQTQQYLSPVVPNRGTIYQ